MIIFITLSFAGAESGPFDLYSDVDGFTTPFAQNVSKADLLLGYEVVAPDGTTTVRLLDLGADCAPFTTDIYNCATPNCDFSGEINCIIPDCNFSGTIVCPAPETTTTTTTGYPGFSPCTWSTYGGNPGEIAVYDFNTNSSTVVLVPNDFTITSGINRPICSTSSKLWLASYPASSAACGNIDITNPEGFPNAVTGNGTKTLSNGVVLTTTFNGPDPIYDSTPGTFDLCDGFYINQTNTSTSASFALKVNGELTMEFDPPINCIQFISSAWGYSGDPRTEGDIEIVSVTSDSPIRGEQIIQCVRGDDEQDIPTYETIQISPNQVNMQAYQESGNGSFQVGSTKITAENNGISKLALTNISPTDVRGVIIDFYVGDFNVNNARPPELQYIREWDIDTSGPTPTLSFVREISIDVDNLSSRGIWGSEITAIATTADNNTLLAGFGARDDGEASMGVYSWDISTSGNILLNENNKIDKATVSFGNTYGITTELTGMFITNDDNVILSGRYYENESPNNASNRVRQYEGLDLSSWTSSSPVINLQQRGVPEFTNAWTSTSKAMPVWGVNGLLQVIQPETLQVYNIDQTGPYNATLSGTVADDTVWIHTSTGCANVNIQYDDCEGATWIPALTEQNDEGEWVYIGPATFTYSGIQVTASATQSNMQLRSGDTVGGIPQEGCSGISNPPANNVLRSIRGFDFTITLTFSQPVNNIPIRAAVLNSQPDLSGGDVYTFDTNTGTPDVSISVGCNVQVQGNTIGGGVPDYDTEGDGEFIISSSTPFTILTISGDAPTGGPLLLGCLDVETTTCTWARPARGTSGVDSFYRYNPLSNQYQFVDLPDSFGAPPENIIGSGSSQNIMFQYLTNSSLEKLSIKRWNLSDLSIVETSDPNNVIDISWPADEYFLASIVCVVDDNTLLLNSININNNPGTGKIYKLVINEDGSYTLTFLFTLGSDRSYWASPIFSNNKIIYQRMDTQDVADPLYIVQRDYTTLDIELEINITDIQIAGTSPDGYFIQTSAQWMFVYEGKMYILVSGIKLYEIDTNFPYNTTLINDNTAFFGPGEFNNQYLRTWSNAGECNGNLSFIPSTSPTTTTTTTVDPSGPSTIWIKFDPITPA